MKRQSIVVGLMLVLLSSGGWAFADCPSADLTGDCFVDFEDFAEMAGQWLNGYDWNDVNTLANQWLDSGVPADPCIMVWVDINDPGVDGNEPFNGQMSKYETTNAQYCQFLNAAMDSNDITVDGDYVKGADGSNSGADFVDEIYYNLSGSGYTYNGATNGGAARINWTGSSFTVDSGFDNHPVTYVSWYGSTAFCNYYGYRLPTEWEWQAVADHTIADPYAYGCGPSINNSIANYYNSTHPDGTTVVGAFGTYGYGMCDMAGNVLEWTDSIYSGSYRVLRGGCWRDNVNHCSVSDRNYLHPDDTVGLIGFRVCR
ncbi:MAG: formylglycine-generating enzyme family protein [Planctomycetota bacterium]|jgi:formylglycine-generating enzyme required for sulfatase activity